MYTKVRFFQKDFSKRCNFSLFFTYIGEAHLYCGTEERKNLHKRLERKGRRCYYEEKAYFFYFGIVFSCIGSCFAVEGVRDDKEL